MSGLWRNLGDLVFPPRCFGCGRLLLPALGQGKSPCFCKSCETEWERACLAQCPQCFAAYLDCTCMPHVMKQAGCAALIKVVPYGEESELRAVRHAVLASKRAPRSRHAAFFAESLREGVEKALADADQKMPISHTVMAHLPRTRQNFRAYGFDQAALIAKALSRLVNVKYVCALRRTHDGKEQKKLTLQERRANVKGAFALRCDVAGKRVILVDDVVTTGAGMAEAVRVLKKGGAAEVIAVCVAATRKRK